MTEHDCIPECTEDTSELMEDAVVDADIDVCGCCDLCDYCYCHWT